MNLFADRLQRMPARHFATVLYIGAGTGGWLDAVAPDRCARLVLFEGDAETAAVLRGAVGDRPGVDVQSVVVTPDGAPCVWHRCSIPHLNGPFPADGLEAYYPRLRSRGQAHVPSTSLTALVDGMETAPGSTSPNLLVLDVPGQEAALLASLDDARLQRFDWILLLGRSAPAGHGHPLPVAVQALASRCYAPVDDGHEAAPSLWCSALLTFDRAAWEQRRLAAALAQEQQRAQRAEEQRDALQAQVQSLAGEADRLRTEAVAATAQIAQLGRERDEHARWHLENKKWAEGLAAQNDALRGEIDALQGRLAAADAQRSALSAQCDAVQQALDTARDAESTASAGWEDALAELQAVREQAAAALAEQTRHAETAAQALQARIAQLTSERDKEGEAHRANAQWASDLQQQVATLEASLDTARAERATLADQQGALQQALDAARTAQAQAAVAQAEQSRLAEEAAQALQARIVALTGERDKEGEAHRANAQWARDLQQQVATLEAALASGRDEVAALVEQQGAMRQALEAARSEQAATQAGLLASQDESRAAQAQAAAAVAALAEQTGLAEQATRELQARVVQLTSERDKEGEAHRAHAKWASDLQRQVATLEASLATARDEIAALTEQQGGLQQALETARSEQAAAQASLQASQDALRAAQTQAEAALSTQTRLAEQAAQELQARIDQLTAERDREGEAHRANAQRASDLQQQVATLEASLNTARSEVAALTDGRGTLQQALEAATAELQAVREQSAAELKAQARIAEQAAATSRAQIDELAASRDQEAHWHQENAKWARGLAAEVDALKSELGTLRQGREAVDAQLAEAQAQVRALRQQLDDRDARQRLMDTEILRAEAQLDLIKDVLLREKNF